MNYPARVVVAVALAALCSAACESTKSSNPLSPSVAGPIGGVTITAPKPLTPANGTELKTTDPVNLLLENATSTSQRPFWFEIQVSTEQDFSAIIHTAQKVTPGGDGRTSYRVPMTLTANRTYFWRARAVDGANTGPYSATPMFRVVDPVHIEAPLPVSPVGGQELDSTTPTLVVRNTAVIGTTAAVVYRFELAADAGFTQLIAIWSAARSGGETTQVTGSPLGVGTEYFWRANASDGAFTSPYSDVQHFKTKSATPAPTPTPTPTPPSGGGGGGSWPTTGEQLIAWTQSHYPQYLVPGSNRTANMVFVRDRMIEAGLCGGMQLGWNLKRGGPEISLDYITWNTGGRWVGVDIAHDADNQNTPLQLTWAPMPDDPYATYGGYSGKLPCQ
jgi:hypothetical protein